MESLRQRYFENAALFQKKHQWLGNPNLEELWTSLSDEELKNLQRGFTAGEWFFHGLPLHSLRDAHREAARAALSIKEARSLVAVSLGAGFLLSELNRQTHAILLIEPSPTILASFLVSGLFQKYGGLITLLSDSLEGGDAMEAILPWLQGKNLKETLIYCHPASFAAQKALYTRAYQRVQALFEKRSVNQATIIKFQRLWNKNIFLNQKTIATSSTLRQFVRNPPPQAVVLAGAGPSLSESLKDLKAERGKFVLFAADTALLPLNRAGIFPDVVFAADPQWVNHYFATSPDAHRSLWALDPVVCPAIPHRLERLGAKIFFWNNVFASDALLRNEDRGDVAHGGSVSTNAFDIAVRWLALREGSDLGRLILVGQDLSFSNLQAHCKGAVLESAVFCRNHRLSSMEGHNLRQMRSMPVLMQKGIKQKSVRTNGKLKIFHEWFCARAAERPAVRLINATVDGLYLPGFEHLSLNDALSGVIEVEKINLTFESLPAHGQQQKIQRLLEGLAQIMRITHESYRLSQEKKPSHAVLQKLNENDALLRETGVAREIAGLNAQALILKITEQGEDVDAAQFYSSLGKAAREVSHWAQKSI